MLVWVCQKPANDVGIVAGVIRHLGNGAIAEIVVASQSGCSRAVLWRGPEGIVALSITVGSCEPRSIGGGVRGGMLIDLANHRRQKRWLRAGKEVGAVRVEDRAIVLDFEEEVFYHSACEVHASVVDQSEENEVAVPSIHLVEAASWHDVAIRQVEQPLDRQFPWPHLTDAVDDAGQMADIHTAVLLHGSDLGRSRHCGRKIEYGRCCDFDINDGLAVRHGARERVPPIADIRANVCLRFILRRGRLCSRCAARVL